MSGREIISNGFFCLENRNHKLWYINQRHPINFMLYAVLLGVYKKRLEETAKRRCLEIMIHSAQRLKSKQSRDVSLDDQREVKECIQSWMQEKPKLWRAKARVLFSSITRRKRENGGVYKLLLLSIKMFMIPKQQLN